MLCGETSAAEWAEQHFNSATTGLGRDDYNPNTLPCQPFESNVVVTTRQMSGKGLTAWSKSPWNFSCAFRAK
jgi:hypothetical protein